jgi:uncharacterized protein YbaR (Trm112 family)
MICLSWKKIHIMNAHSEIVRLFKSLSEDEKGLVLKELGQASMGETVLLEEADVVCCPHCESRLFVRNGSGGQNKSISAKLAVRYSQQKQGLLCTGCKNLKNLSYTGH